VIKAVIDPLNISALPATQAPPQSDGFRSRILRGTGRACNGDRTVKAARNCEILRGWRGLGLHRSVQDLKERKMHSPLNKQALSRAILACVLTAAVAGGIANSAAAQERHDRDWYGRGWHDDDIRRFHERDVDVWRGGHWWHGRHDGRPGWWWVVGNAWYFYPTPVYPYPDPYQPPSFAPPPAPPANYYYCNNPAGYYPYVQACNVPWRMVPAG
jgi:hypothetical protein